LISSADDFDTCSLTASHEAIEMLVDPFGNRMIAGDSPKEDQGRVTFLVEPCDPSEDASFAYTVNGVLVSDFYTPHFFDPVEASGIRYSYTGAVTRPREVLKGGYLSWLEPESNHFWQEIFFDGSNEPSFRDIGPLTEKDESLRTQIDRLTSRETAKAVEKGRARASAVMLTAEANKQASSGYAHLLRQRINEIVQSSQRIDRERAPTVSMRQPGRVRRPPGLAAE
jgi:hypothetical protein